MQHETKYLKLNTTTQPLSPGSYEDCLFEQCDLSMADLTGYSFIECTFTDCNLSSVNLKNTALQDVQFTNCKLLGIRFDHCKPFLFSVKFEGCQLNFSTFFKLNLKKTVFKKCQLLETDFAEADLSSASLDECDLMGAIFDGTNLERADLSTARNYQIDPDNNRIKHAKFSMPEVLTLLRKYDIQIL